MNPKNNTVRLQSAEKLFERIAADVGPFIQHGYHPEWGPKCADRPPYTPPSNVAAWLRKYDIENPKGRDIEALTKAAKRKPVGYWEDAPHGAKFTQDSTCPKCGNMMVAGHHCTTGGAKFGGGGDARAGTVALGSPQVGEPWPVADSTAPSSDSDLYEPVGRPVVGGRVVRLQHPDVVGTVFSARRGCSGVIMRAHQNPARSLERVHQHERQRQADGGHPRRGLRDPRRQADSARAAAIPAVPVERVHLHVHRQHVVPA